MGFFSSEALENPWKRRPITENTVGCLFVIFLFWFALLLIYDETFNFQHLLGYMIPHPIFLQSKAHFLKRGITLNYSFYIAAYLDGVLQIWGFQFVFVFGFFVCLSFGFFFCCFLFLLLFRPVEKKKDLF